MKIAEVSERYGISSDTLRYYERIGLILPINRNGSGIRDYNELDLRRVDFIKCMRGAGLPVEVAGVTVNRLCASGLNAINMAARAIKAGEGDVYIDSIFATSEYFRSTGAISQAEKYGAA